MPTTITGTDGVSQVQAGAVEKENLFAGFANGITQADVWRLTASNGSDGDITANLERADDPSSGLIGSGVSESSGIFTFPETGIWEVTAVLSNNSASIDTHTLHIYVTIDGGSNYDLVASASCGDSGNRNNSGACTALVDCNNTSNVKVKFNLSSFSTGAAIGSTSANKTHFKFIRLGDT